jgi:DNA-binding SARP family transcriptional activator
MQTVDLPHKWVARLAATRLCVLGLPRLKSSSEVVTLDGVAARVIQALCDPVRQWRSIEELIDATWGSEPPATARPALHVHLGTARRWLTSAPDQAPEIERSGAGYRLALNDAELDVSLAADMINHGRNDVRNAPRRALALARAALELWDAGPALVDWSDAAADGRASRYELLRLTAEELEVEALLTLGSYAEAERAASRLVEQEPYRELRWAQLMRARYFDNRPNDALDTYQSVRRLLRDDLGSEPGQLLRDLERSVLMQDLDDVSAATGRLSADMHQPAIVGPIFGREEDVERSVDLLKRHRSIALVGPPGVGKTRLAQELCGRVIDDALASSVVWVDLHHSHDPLRMLSLSIGIAPDSSLDEICQRLSAQRVFVVFDNAEHLIERVGEVVERLQRELPDPFIVVTTTTRPHSPVSYEVKPLALPSAVLAPTDAHLPSMQLLRSALDAAAPGVSVSDHDAAQICRLCGGLPLALRLVANELRVVDIDVVRQAGRLVGTSRLDDRLASVIGHLDDESELAFETLALLPGAFDYHLAHMATGLDEEAFRRVFVVLADSSLIEVIHGSPQRFRVLPPLRSHIARTKGTALPTSTLSRIATYCLDQARALAPGFVTGNIATSDEDFAEMLKWVRLALEHFEKSGESERALRLTVYLEPTLYARGWWKEKTNSSTSPCRFPASPRLPGPERSQCAGAMDSSASSISQRFIWPVTLPLPWEMPTSARTQRQSVRSICGGRVELPSRFATTAKPWRCFGLAVKNGRCLKRSSLPALPKWNSDRSTPVCASSARRSKDFVARAGHLLWPIPSPCWATANGS